MSWLRYGLFSTLPTRSLAVRFISTSSFLHDKSQPRQHTRIIKKIISPEGEEMSKVETKLEGNYQAQSLAKEVARQMRFGYAEKKQNRKKLDGEPITTSNDNVEEFDEEDDELPPGMDWSMIPKFRKIYGWEKGNKRLKKLQKMLSHTPKESNTIVLEGKRLITDAMKAGFYPSVFVFSRVNLLKGFDFDLTKNLAMYQVPYKNIQGWSELSTSPGFLALFNKDEIDSHVKARTDRITMPLTIILDNVRGPDNMGAVLRIAAAVGCRRIITTSGCVNPWQPKALRAAAGAHFHVPIEHSVSWDKIHEHVPKYAQVVLADINRGDDSSEDNALEQHELSSKLAELEERCRDFIVQDEAETPDQSPIENTDEGVMEAVEKALETKEPIGHKDLSYWSEEIINEYQNLPLVSRPYYDFNRFNRDQETVVIIGGETEGVSGQAKKFTHSLLGERIFIPLLNEVESLNVVSAASVILFEIKKELSTI